MRIEVTCTGMPIGRCLPIRRGSRGFTPHVVLVSALNVGRTASITFSSCNKPDPLQEPHVYRSHGVDLSKLDSLQILNACDPGDSPMWKPRGFRHEIVLLSPALLTEADSLLPVVPRAPVPSAVELTNYSGPPIIMCGRAPELFPCTHDFPPLRLMEWREQHVCTYEPWSRLIRQCVRDPKWFHTRPRECLAQHYRPRDCPVHQL